ncbi:MAG: RdgB/HAM1 family non-canonical purine NTP pyrophosphatase [Candidatus Neomarinimicrobiota bacterium]
MKVLLATRNIHKVEEISAVLENLDFEIYSLVNFPEIGEIEETGSTLLENSLIKARTAFKFTGIPAIADDTGLEVDALYGAPGVFSARYAGEKASYEENCSELLKNLKPFKEGKRSAQFRTVLSYVDQDREFWTEGIIRGVITTSPRGKGGFGYDSIFMLPELNKTFAELNAAGKNAVSHRGRALKNLRKLLQKQL